jgi:glycine cleavage system aminomethyltransferase T
MAASGTLSFPCAPGISAADHGAGGPAVPSISPSPRIRRSPYYDETIVDGVQAFSVYNRMLMPTSYGDAAAEYRRLTEGVAMWDVACERQVEITGPDAARLVQALVPRRIDRLAAGMGWYAPVCDHRGVLINDPILLKLAENHFWFSIADSDLRLWALAVAGERRLDVEVTEPDVSPLAIQGPKAEDVVAALLGDSVRSLGHFRFRETELDGIPLVVARSGWSHQGGFELYLRDGSRGGELWRRVREAGAPFGIGPGAPNQSERVESGLLSWGGDTDDQTNPYEVRMGRYVDLQAPDDTIGIEALRRLHEQGPQRHQLGVALEGDEPLQGDGRWATVIKGPTAAGHVTAQAWSPRLGRNIGLCLVRTSVVPGDKVRVVTADGGEVRGEVRKLPFL